jgi:N-acyl-D-amino-acid deacylase
MSSPSNEVFDIVITDGTIIDGTGQPRYVSDLGVQNGFITAIGSLTQVEARLRINASRLIVSPGFIDIHTHSDISLLLNPIDEARLQQGVTTVVFSNCGLGFAPANRQSIEILKKAYSGIFGDWHIDRSWQTVREFLALFQDSTTVNIAYLIPHVAIRAVVMGMVARAATEREISQMSELVEQGMRDGAFGLSTGLYYAPMSHASRDELLSLLERVQLNRGFFAIHLRDYFEGLVPALAEALELAETAHVPVQISHLQAAGQSNWGKAKQLLSMIDESRQRGVDVMVDSYPYMAGSTYLHSLVPDWAQADGPEEILKRFAEKNTLQQIIRDLSMANVDWSSVIISGLATSSNQPLLGCSIKQIAAKRKLAIADTVCQLLVEENLAISFVYHHGNEADVCQIMRHHYQMIGSDGLQVGQRPHPRLFGSFARYLGHYVRDARMLQLEEAIRKITTLPASRLGLSNRGQLAEGMAADVVVFNEVGIEDRATYDDPCQPAHGVAYVIVNGKVVKDPMDMMNKPAGQLLMHTSEQTARQ